MWLIHYNLLFLLMLLILEILLPYCYQDHCYQINLILGILRVHPCPCLTPQKYLPKCILQACIQGFLHHIFCLNFLSYSPKWVFLVPTQTLNTSSSMGNSTQSSLWISLLVYSDMKKCPPSSFNHLKEIMRMILIFNMFVVHMYTMA